MAGKKEQLEVGIVATDKASKVIKDVAKGVEELDGESAEVELTADDKASADITALKSRIKDLSDEDQKVILTAESSQLTREVANATRLLGKLDGEEFTAVLDARNTAQKKLDAVNEDLDTFDKRTVDATLEATDHASGTIKTVDGKLDTFDKRTVDATLDAKEGTGLSSILDDIDGIPSSLTTVGRKLGGLSGPTGAIALVGGAFVAAAAQAADLAIQADEIATLTGSSVTKASALAAVLRDNTNVEASDLLDIVAQLTGVLAQNPGILDQIGLKADANRTPFDTFVAVVDALNNSQLTANEKILLGSQLFGEEGVRQINTLVSALNGRDLATAISDIAEQRLITEDDVTAARDLKSELTEAGTQAQALATTVGTALLPVLAKAAEGLTAILNPSDTGNLGGIGPSDQINQIISDSEAADQATTDLWTNTMVLVGQGADAYDTATTAVEDNTDAARESAEARDRISAAIDTQVAALDDEIDTLGDEVDALEDSRDAQLDMIDAKRKATDSEYAAREAQDDFNESLDAYNDIQGHSARRERERAAALEDVRKSAVAAADADTERAVAIAKANGVTLTATETVDDWNRSIVRSAAQAKGPARQAILDYAFSYNEIPNDKRTEIQTAIDAGDLAEAQRLLDAASAPRKAAVRADADQASINAADAQLNTLTKTRGTVIQAQADLKQANTDLNNFVNRYRPAEVQVQARYGTIIKRAAQGTPSAQPGLTLVGERGPELVEMRGGERVHTASQTAAMAAVRPQVVNHIVINQPAGVTDRDTAAAVRRYSRIQGVTAA